MSQHSTAIPAPSRKQVQEWFVKHFNIPEGLDAGWAVSSHRFDPYDLLCAVLRNGGSKQVSSTGSWPSIASTLHLHSNGLATVNVPTGLESFFGRYLAELESLWDRTLFVSSQSPAAVAALTAASAAAASERSQSHGSTQVQLPTRDESSVRADSSPSLQSRPHPAAAVPNASAASWNPLRLSHIASSTPSPTLTASIDPQRLRLHPANPPAQQKSAAPPISEGVRTSSAPNSASSSHATYPLTGPLQAPPSHSAPMTMASSSHATYPSSTGPSPAPPPRSGAVAAPPNSAQAPQSSQSSRQPRSSHTALPAPRHAAPPAPSSVPTFANFAELVTSDFLPLPPASPSVPDSTALDELARYSLRCRELYATVRKINSGRPARALTGEEQEFWKRLLEILRVNKGVVIPGPAEDATTAAQQASHTASSLHNAPSQPGHANGTHVGAEGTATGLAHPASAPALATNVLSSTVSLANGTQPKRRGRPPKDPNAPPKPRKPPKDPNAPPKRIGRPPKDPNAPPNPKETTYSESGASTAAASSAANGHAGPSGTSTPTAAAVTSQPVGPSSTPAADFLRMMASRGGSMGPPIAPLSVGPATHVAQVGIAKPPAPAHNAHAATSTGSTGGTQPLPLKARTSAMSFPPRLAPPLRPPVKAPPPPAASPPKILGLYRRPLRVSDVGPSGTPMRTITLSTGHTSVAHMKQADTSPSFVPSRPALVDKKAVLQSTIPDSIDRSKVVIPISRRRRAELIELGAYIPVRDDDVEGRIVRRHLTGADYPTGKSLTLEDRVAKAREPEAVPDRFFKRAGPGLTEPFRSILSEESLLRRAISRLCEWDDCDSDLASEWHLAKHIEKREHALAGRFLGGHRGHLVLFRCLWEDCSSATCFDSAADLKQHITAKHVSKSLVCPFKDCGLTSPSLSHLSRHVFRHHAPNEPLRPLADLSERVPPAGNLAALPPLPHFAHADELTLSVAVGSAPRTARRRENIRARIQRDCVGGEDKEMHVVHHVPMVEHVEGEVGAGPDGEVQYLGEAEGSVYSVDAELDDSDDDDGDLLMPDSQAVPTQRRRRRKRKNRGWGSSGKAAKMPKKVVTPSKGTASRPLAPASTGSRRTLPAHTTPRRSAPDQMAAPLVGPSRVTRAATLASPAPTSAKRAHTVLSPEDQVPVAASARGDGTGVTAAGPASPWRGRLTVYVEIPMRRRPGKCRA